MRISRSESGSRTVLRSYPFVDVASFQNLKLKSEIRRQEVSLYDDIDINM
jgi:hypothetical protein